MGCAGEIIVENAGENPVECPTEFVDESLPVPETFPAEYSAAGPTPVIVGPCPVGDPFGLPSYQSLLGRAAGIVDGARDAMPRIGEDLDRAAVEALARAGEAEILNDLIDAVIVARTSAEFEILSGAMNICLRRWMLKVNEDDKSNAGKMKIMKESAAQAMDVWLMVHR